jgi:hypothetical protein
MIMHLTIGMGHSLNLDQKDQKAGISPALQFLTAWRRFGCTTVEQGSLVCSQSFLKELLVRS